jgi:hypothetical protein
LLLWQGLHCEVALLLLLLLLLLAANCCCCWLVDLFLVWVCISHKHQHCQVLTVGHDTLRSTCTYSHARTTQQ